MSALVAPLRAAPGRTAAWALCGLSVALVAATAVAGGGDVLRDSSLALSCVLGTGMALIGAFVLTRYPGHPIGWLFVAGALSRSVAAASQVWAVTALVRAPGSVPGGMFASWLQAWTLLPSFVTAPLIVVLFPDGRLPGKPWRVVPVLAGTALLLVGVVAPAGMWPYRGPRLLPGAPTPDVWFVNAAIVAGAVLSLAGVVLALMAIVLRARRAAGEVRQQVKWFGLGAASGLVLNSAGLIAGLSWARVLGAIAVLGGIALGVFRFRLYDIDRLIKRTLVYGLVTVVLVAAFAALDVALAVVTGRGSAVITAGSAFVVALLLRPARDRIQDVVDRVFARHQYHAVRVIRSLASQIGREPVPPLAVLTAIRQALSDPAAQVAFHGSHPGTLIDGAGSPVASPVPAPGQVADEVSRGGEPIAVVVHAAADPGLCRVVLDAAVPLLGHAQLQAELAVQLGEVRASRARLAAAADAERRRIERDLHDGAQQRLVGLALHVQSARRRGASGPELAEVLAFTVEQLHAGVSDIRALVHGILPPALAGSGLAAAIAELARPGQVSVICEVRDRLDPGIEATAWFVASEGVANAAKHAAGRAVRVSASVAGDRLLVHVSDDGPGGARADGRGLRNLADRVEAHGGSLTVDSPPGGGTRLAAVLPCAS